MSTPGATARNLMASGSVSEGVESRRVALDVLDRVDRDGAYANLALPSRLAESELDARDRGFVTELVYGTLRRRRSVDHLVDRHVERTDVELRVRNALRMGAYQLRWTDVADHAAVDATVSAVPKRARGFVNAVLRKVARDASTYQFPTDALRLSVPDWLLDRLRSDLGDRAVPVIEAMNERAVVHTRPDGYRQDTASQEVGRLFAEVADGSVIADLCAAPGGKATHIAGLLGCSVAALDRHAHRAKLVDDAADLTSTAAMAVVADATAPPLRPGVFDGVLVDAPCSGLGSLRRRPDARWRITADDIGSLRDLQFDLVAAARDLLRPGGILVFSVCTLTDAESLHVDDRVADAFGDLLPVALSEPWEQHGRGGRLLPDRFDGDGMTAFAYRRSP